MVVVAAVTFVVGCAIVEPRVSADSYRYWPTGLGAIEQLALGVFQALAVLGLPIIVLAGMIGDSIVPEVLSARPRPAGAVVPLQPANGRRGDLAISVPVDVHRAVHPVH
jgi:hypothetical protein